ncbi:MAG: NADH-ubiquinone oxidoreductase chain [Myxococcales bacterium]|nr:NADH-ubiquinone oxidoreductase chain [Myxococcales bacterium]
MNDFIFNIGYAHFLVLSAVMFLIGTVGVMVRRNALIILMSVELMLNAANMALLTFSRMWGGSEALSAHTFALIVIGVAAAEASVGLAITVAVFRGRRNVDVDRLTSLRH